jgi:hypothetical protein
MPDIRPERQHWPVDHKPGERAVAWEVSTLMTATGMKSQIEPKNITIRSNYAQRDLR